jgi:signal transduction histidine kinase
MSLFVSKQTRARLWLAETTVGALEVAARCPDVDEVLKFWAREIARAVFPYQVAIFVVEGQRWLRVLPENQSGDLPFLTEVILAKALGAPDPLRIQSMGKEDPNAVLLRYSAKDSWRGVLALWSFRRRLSRRQVRHAQEIAGAIGRSATALRKSEVSQEQAIASERARWAAELHDGHLQSLSSAKLHTEVCLSLEEQHQELCLSLGAAHQPSRLRGELSRLHDLLNDTVREARQFLLELRSPPVNPDQFLPWLRAYADDFERESGIRVELRLEGEGDLSKSQVEETTRLLREALTNVRKHAKAAVVRIAIAFSEQTVTMSVSDDGVGFDVPSTLERLMDSSHNGLIGIRYRAESIGGDMRLRSKPGQGTTLVFRLPRMRRHTEDGRRRMTVPPASAPMRVPAQDLSVRDSIRETLAELIGSFIEKESGTGKPEPRS